MLAAALGAEGWTADPARVQREIAAALPAYAAAGNGGRALFDEVGGMIASAWWEYFIGPDWWWVILVKAVIVLLFLITAGAYLTLAERKVAARIQLRIGPNRVGPLGLLQPLADAVKLLFKENTAPSGRDKLLYLVAPSLAGAAAMFAFAAIPISAVNCIGGPSIGQAQLTCPSGYALHWDIAHVNVGLLFILASPRSASTRSSSAAGRPTASTRCSAGCAPRRSSSPTRWRSPSP